MKNMTPISLLFAVALVGGAALWWQSELDVGDGAVATDATSSCPVIEVVRSSSALVASAEEAPVEVVAVPVARESADDAVVPLLGAAKEDVDRLLCLNSALRKAGLPPIDEGSRIRLADLDAYRAIVDAAEKAVDGADNQWSKHAVAVTQALADDVRKRLQAGQTTGLPFAGKDNSLSRRHPHEAIRHLSAGGRSFVVRVSPGECPELADLGRVYDVEVEKRAHDYNTLVRSLVIANVGK